MPLLSEEPERKMAFLIYTAYRFSTNHLTTNPFLKAFLDSQFKGMHFLTCSCFWLGRSGLLGMLAYKYGLDLCFIDCG